MGSTHQRLLGCGGLQLLLSADVRSSDDVITFGRPMLMAAEEAAVVNTSSVAGFCPPAAGYCTPYAISKYAVRGFSEHLLLQCRAIAPHITVTCG